MAIVVVVVVLDVAVVGGDAEVVVPNDVVVESTGGLVEVDVELSADVSHARALRASKTTKTHLNSGMTHKVTAPGYFSSPRRSFKARR